MGRSVPSALTSIRATYSSTARWAPSPALSILEFINAIPAQFARNPQPWLSTILPETRLDNGYFRWLLEQYGPLLEEFLEAMRRVEEAAGYGSSSEETPLSSHVLESWNSDLVWFHYAASFSDQVDSVYWEVLHKRHPGGAALVLAPDQEAELSKYLEHTENQKKMDQLAWDKYFDR